MALPRGPLLSPASITPIVTGAVYNATAPAPQDQQGCSLQCDSQGNLLVNVAVGGGSTVVSENLAQVGGAPISLGQAPAAASLPVILTAAQVATLTPLSTVAVSNFPATQSVSGTVAVSNFPATQVSPTIYKTVSVTAGTSGNSAVWTPTAGKKFQLMRFQITGCNLTATAASVVTLSFQDAAVGITIGTYEVLLPAVATATDVLFGGNLNLSDGWIDLGNGILSSTINNVLNLNVSSAPAGATGNYRVNVAGIEV
jgi:hypothetical protein